MFFFFFSLFFVFSFSSFVDLRFGLELLSLSLVLIDDLEFLDTLALFKVSDDTLRCFPRMSNK